MAAFIERRRDSTLNFGLYLRTGRAVELAPVELKFNHNHDPKDGRFAFSSGGSSATRDRSGPPPSQSKHGQAASKMPPSAPARPRPAPKNNGSFAGGGGGSFGGGGATGYYLSVQDIADFKRQHPHMDPHLVMPGDTLESMAHDIGTSPTRLASINGLPVEAKLRPGDVLRFKTPEEKVQNPPPKATAVILHSLSFSEPTYNHVVKNGYDFAIDSSGRTREIDGALTKNPDQLRNLRTQAAAGGSDRLKNDHGGHYIARRFDGPTDAFNHFAQDGTFNRSDYAKLENEWSREMHDGRIVRVYIVPFYKGSSRRPSAIAVRYTVDHQIKRVVFSNKSGDKQ